MHVADQRLRDQRERARRDHRPLRPRGIRRGGIGLPDHRGEVGCALAPPGGIALFDDPTEWIGKPVQTGERILRIAAPGDVEVEAWLPIGDAIPLAEGAPLLLYLASDPLASIAAKVRYVAHDAVARPDGSYAYRVRARLDGPTAQRVGLKGTAKISGDRVPLAYWMLRRPWATVRQALGW